MKLAIACDHGGFEMKEALVKHLTAGGYEVTDFGIENPAQGVDYPDYAAKVCQAVTAKEVASGILICGTGIGMSMAANKFKGIRAAVVGDVFSAQATKEHNNANVICLGQRVLGEGLAEMIVDTWLTAEFQGGRHQNRIDKISQLEVNL
ncbi:ribose 5-phosphate isomerase B [Enterococcus sp. PF1-24]|uniref:ribose 5-phosphate isomerase B n=1 Tax=unclassified Enterococcus TaxID=2608891 RepID=UPI0024740552|nr:MULTISPECIES: ribose 5-phosphate isomerase B [unclassified Enterococcus]MDH6363985.1 ribose 5-phosphate isomerase B [Enterococcus sp. PFB1-1]MDH6401086.1 ribose 5-phosphate isomerase B [Enterococcus sp. PF1-24]